MNNELMFSSKTDLWSTPWNFFDKLNDEFHFTLDPCSTHENAKCYKHFTIEEDGLLQDWGNEVVFAIHLTEGRLKTGLKKLTMNHKKIIQPL
ncbi:phage N-6-adenine-methyltransferase [Lactococcus lactis]|nr:DNA N-6-adenine-methyltransferase [Lactococcus lactis]MDG4967110.1 phage N-6-adenine-methyltransferase [Lactococcus lactis]